MTEKNERFPCQKTIINSLARERTGKEIKSSDTN